MNANKQFVTLPVFDCLLRQHLALRGGLASLREIVRSVSRNETPPDAWLPARQRLAAILRSFLEDLCSHQKEEEANLFPKLLPILRPAQKILLVEVAAEHEALQRSFERAHCAIRRWLRFDSPPKKAEGLRARVLLLRFACQLLRHETTEDKFLLPLAKKLLPVSSDNVKSAQKI